MPKRKDENKKDRIVKAALTVMLEKGVDGLRMVDVADTAGIATGTIYIYYKDKSLLIQDIYREVNRKVANSMLKNQDNNASFIVSFRLLWRNFLNFCITNPEEHLFLKQQSPHITPIMETSFNPYYHPIAVLLDRGKSQGLVLPVPTQLLTAQIIGGIQEIAEWHRQGKFTLDNKGFEYAYKMSWNSIRR